MGNVSGSLRKVGYSVGANLVGLAVSLVVTLVVPGVLKNDVAQYGYLQIFIFYVGYAGLLHFGWCDGILLKEAGKSFDSLDKAECSTQIRLMAVMQLLLSALVGIIGFCLAEDEGYRFIWVFVAVNIAVTNLKNILAYYLQATGRVKEFSLATLFQFIIYGASVVCFIFADAKDYRSIVVGYTAGQVLALLVNTFSCRELVFSRGVPRKQGLKEALNNISIGYKLLFANVASLLVTGIVRIGIERSWGVETYGRIALTFSVSNMVLTFISAIEVVLFPELKKAPQDKLQALYGSIERKLLIFMFGCFCFFYPAQLLLTAWLPAYTESISYMAILLPICIFTAKVNLQVQNYMKVYRLENDIFWVNAVSIFMSAAATVISVAVFKNLSLALILVVAVQMLRCVLAEMMLGRRTGINVYGGAFWEVVLSVFFIVGQWFIGGPAGTCVYIAGFIIFLAWTVYTMKREKS